MRISRHWRLNAQRYALQGVNCPHCSANIFPPREVCPYCGNQTDESVEAVQARQETRATVRSAREVLTSAAR